jgi:GNAT superfamily N-acetyltransferase
MEEGNPHIEVRALQVEDTSALLNLGYEFETDRIYTLRVRECLLGSQSEHEHGDAGRTALSFELVDTPIDPPIYKNYFEGYASVEAVEERVRHAEGGYVALADGEVAGGVLLGIEEWRSVAQIQEFNIGRQYRRYGIGSLLLKCASDWARERDCWAITLETQNTNYPAIQFYLRNGLEVWGINRHFYPPGPVAHEIAIIMGKSLLSQYER